MCVMIISKFLTIIIWPCLLVAYIPFILRILLRILLVSLVTLGIIMDIILTTARVSDSECGEDDCLVHEAFGKETR